MSTIIRKARELAFAAVDSTPLDGTTAGRTFQPVDRLASACIALEKDTDAVVITISGTGSANNTVAFNLYGYGIDTPAERIFDSVTATLGTAVAGSGQLYADTISGTDLHTQSVGVYDSGNDTVCKIVLDTMGLRWLYFEPETFTTLTACKFIVREVGQI